MQADTSMIGQLGGSNDALPAHGGLSKNSTHFLREDACTAHTQKSVTFFYVVLVSGSHLPGVLVQATVYGAYCNNFTHFRCEGARPVRT